MLPLACQMPLSGRLSSLQRQHASDRLVVNNVTEPESLDPSHCFEGVCAAIVEDCFARLLSFNPQTQAPTPEIAYTWDISDDGLVYTFYLRPSWWSDGEPLTAADFVLAFQRAIDPASGSRVTGLFLDIAGAADIVAGTKPAHTAGVEALADDILQLRLAHPAPYLLYLVSSTAFSPVPRHVLRKLAAQHLPEHLWTEAPYWVSNGAYQVSKRHFKYHMILEKNPEYWQPQGHIQHIELLQIASPITALNLYRTGYLDWLGANGALPAELIKPLQNSEDLFQEKVQGSHFLWINTQKAPLNNLHLRQALSLAIDRQNLVKHVAAGEQTPMSSLVPATLTDYPGPKPVLFDANQARAQLQQAGYDRQHAPTLSLLFNSGSASNQHLVEAIAHMWEVELGIHVVLQQQEWKVFLATLQSGQFDLARGGWVGDYPDPASFLQGMLGKSGQNNVSGWVDDDFEALLRLAAAQPTTARRWQQLAAAEARMLAAQPIIPLFGMSITTLKRPDLLGVYPHPLLRHPFRWMHLQPTPSPSL